jgi:hypothetical protein
MIFRTTNFPLDLKYFCAFKLVIETIFGKAHRESTPILVINPVFIIEIVLVMKVSLALVDCWVGVPSIAVDISCPARIHRIRVIGVTIESIAVPDDYVGLLTQTASF